MELTYETIRPITTMIGLVFFFTFFIGVLVWVYRPGSKKLHDEHASIPFKED